MANSNSTRPSGLQEEMRGEQCSAAVDGNLGATSHSCPDSSCPISRPSRLPQSTAISYYSRSSGLHECLRGESWGSFHNDDTDEDDEVCVAMAGLSDGQRALLQELYNMDSCDETFSDFMLGWMHEAAEDGHELGTFIDMYLQPCCAENMEARAEASLAAGVAGANPFIDQLLCMSPMDGWRHIYNLVSRLSRAKFLSASKLRHHFPANVSEDHNLQLAATFPMFVRTRMQGAASCLELVWPARHDSRCPRFGLSRSSSHRQKCTCALLVVSAVRASAGQDDDFCAGDAGSSDGDADTDESDTDEWWSWADSGGGCDAYAVVHRFAGRSGLDERP